MGWIVVHKFPKLFFAILGEFKLLISQVIYFFLCKINPRHFFIHLFFSQYRKYLYSATWCGAYLTTSHSLYLSITSNDDSLIGLSPDATCASPIRIMMNTVEAPRNTPTPRVISLKAYLSSSVISCKEKYFDCL